MKTFNYDIEGNDDGTPIEVVEIIRYEAPKIISFTNNQAGRVEFVSQMYEHTYKKSEWLAEAYEFYRSDHIDRVVEFLNMRDSSYVTDIQVWDKSDWT